MDLLAEPALVGGPPAEPALYRPSWTTLLAQLAEYSLEVRMLFLVPWLAQSLGDPLMDSAPIEFLTDPAALALHATSPPRAHRHRRRAPRSAL